MVYASVADAVLDCDIATHRHLIAEEEVNCKIAI